jgi:hypothetical protein
MDKGKKRGEGKRVPVSYELSQQPQTPVAYCSLHFGRVRRIAGKANTQKKTRLNVQTLGDGREHVAHTREQACNTACTPRKCSNILKNRKEWGLGVELTNKAWKKKFFWKNRGAQALCFDPRFQIAL